MNFKDPRKGMALSAAGGPATNIVLAIISTLIFKLLLPGLAVISPQAITDTVLKPLHLMMAQSVEVNVILAVFNMIPVPPLDGGRVLVGLLPTKHAMSFSRIEPYGFIIVILLIATGIANQIIMPFIIFFLKLLRMY
jgi:Zn-dependent protease